MKIENIKHMVKIPDFLSFLGVKPVNTKGDFWHYRSPFREDKKPSFWVNIKTDTCGDFAEGKIGDVINLAARWYNCDIKTAAANIVDTFRLGGFSFAKPTIHRQASSHPTKAATESKIYIKHTQSLQNVALLQYVAARGITPEVAKEYLQEVYYKTSDTETAKQYFALAFKNDKGGYELRSQYFKGSTTPKAPTTICHNSDTVVIFEGFMDFLSCIELWNSQNKIMPYDVIVLNSVCFAPKTDLSKYRSIKLLLDNDKSGIETTKSIITRYPQAKNLTPQIIGNNKDFNDFWTHKIGIK